MFLCGHGNFNPQYRYKYPMNGYNLNCTLFIEIHAMFIFVMKIFWTHLVHPLDKFSFNLCIECEIHVILYDSLFCFIYNAQHRSGWIHLEILSFMAMNEDQECGSSFKDDLYQRMLCNIFVSTIISNCNPHTRATFFPFITVVWTQLLVVYKTVSRNCKQTPFNSSAFPAYSKKSIANNKIDGTSICPDGKFNNY